MNNRTEILTDLHSIPSIPAVAVKLFELLGDPDVELDRIVETMKYDPAITAKALQLANSACFGSSRSVVSLKDALVRLGTSQVYRLVIAASVQPVLNQPLAGYSMDSGELWRHGVAVGVAAESIQDLLGSSKSDLAFTAGLLHDIGKLVMGSYVERDFDSIEQKSSKEKISFESAEAAVLDIDHTEVGAELLEQWGFPANLVAVVRWHHDPNQAPDNQHLVDIVHVADMTCMMMGIGLGRDGLQYKPSAESMSRLGMKEKDLELVACITLGAMDEILKMFKVDGGG